jgi:hypothetical protein
VIVAASLRVAAGFCSTIPLLISNTSCIPKASASAPVLVQIQGADNGRRRVLRPAFPSP